MNTGSHTHTKKKSAEAFSQRDSASVLHWRLASYLPLLMYTALSSPGFKHFQSVILTSEPVLGFKEDETGVTFTALASASSVKINA